MPTRDSYLAIAAQGAGLSAASDPTAYQAFLAGPRDGAAVRKAFLTQSSCALFVLACIRDAICQALGLDLSDPADVEKLAALEPALANQYEEEQAMTELVGILKRASAYSTGPLPDPLPDGTVLFLANAQHVYVTGCPEGGQGAMGAAIAWVNHVISGNQDTRSDPTHERPITSWADLNVLFTYLGI